MNDEHFAKEMKKIQSVVSQSFAEGQYADGACRRRQNEP